MAVIVVTPPAGEPIALSEAKTHLRVDGTDEDMLIGGLIVAAREWCEGFQQRAYVTQTLELSLDGWPPGSVFKVPRAPLRRVESITYTDRAGVATIWSPSNYIVDARTQPGRIALAYGKAWPAVPLQPISGVVIRYSAGHDDAGKVPQKVKQALFLLIGHWYEHREAVLTGTISKEIEFALTSLLWQDRCF